MEFPPPKSLETEHEGIHAQLVPLTKEPGRVGDAARAVAARLHEHFVIEERYAVPPLGLLRPLAEGGVTPAMRAILATTDRLRTELPRMLAEHRAIGEALTQLALAAEAEHRRDASEFVEKLRLHVATEEELLYPAALLVGEHVKALAK